MSDSKATNMVPTVGRIVWYRPHTYEMTHKHGQPLAAIITHVWSAECVNLHVFGDNGAHLPSKTSVLLAQGRPGQPGECEWMPYQVGQARKTEDAEKAAAAMSKAIGDACTTGVGIVTVRHQPADTWAVRRQNDAVPAPTMRDPLGQRCRQCVGAGGCRGGFAECTMGNACDPASERAIEAAIQAKGLGAPRLRPQDLDAEIVDAEIVSHVSLGGQVLRWCVLTLRNGFAVTGRPSVSVSPENDDAEVGVAVAKQNARNEMWPLLGYALKDRLHRGEPIKAGCTD